MIEWKQETQKFSEDTFARNINSRIRVQLDTRIVELNCWYASIGFFSVVIVECDLYFSAKIFQELPPFGSFAYFHSRSPAKKIKAPTLKDAQLESLTWIKDTCLENAGVAVEAYWHIVGAASK